MAKQRKNKQGSKVSSNISTQVGGNVKLTVMQGKQHIMSKVVHNTGTYRFFQGLIQACSGVSVAGYVPKYISAGSALLPPGTNPLEMVGLVQEYLITRPLLESLFTNPIISDASVKGTCRGFISYSDVPGIIKELGLFGTANTNSLLARIEITEGIQLSPGQTLVVEWDIAIENKTN